VKLEIKISLELDLSNIAAYKSVIKLVAAVIILIAAL
jgi:hypothetical protein